MRLSRTTRSGVLVLLIVTFSFSTSLRAASDFLSLDILWSARLDSPPLAPPVIDSGRAYISLRGGKILSLALADGLTAWTTEVPVTTPITALDGLVVGATRNAVVAIDGRTGRERWRVPVADVAVGPALRGGWVVVGSGPDLLAFRAADGSLVWRVRLGAALVSSVTIEGDRVYAPLEDGSLAALEITGGTIVWRTRLPAPGGSVTAVGDRLYLGGADKFFYALDAKDGERAWRWRVSAAVLAPVAVDESRVYYTALDNVIRAVDARSGVQKWRYAMDTRPLAGPTLDDTVLVVASASDLRVVRTADGTLAGKWGAPAELASAPVFVARTNRASGARVVIVTGAATGDWRVYGLAASVEPAPQPLKEIPGRPLSPDVPPVPPGPPTPVGRFHP